MRFLAILPVLLCTAALVLTFLCLFAGSSPGFMEDYAIITLNTSRFGEDFINTTSSDSSSSNILQTLLDNLTSTIEQDIDNGINDIARSFGLRDFYSLHVLDYCEGYYEPTSLPNATVSLSQIWKNTTACSNRTTLFDWDPRELIQAELNASGHSYIDISSLKWPTEIDDDISNFRGEVKATFVLYCIAIILTFAAFATAILSFFFRGRIFSLINVSVDVLAFLAIMVASALVTAVMTEGTKNINASGESVGIESYYSSKFLALTWVAAVLMFVASCVWCLDCVVGRRDKSSRRTKGHEHHEDDQVKLAHLKSAQ